MSDNEDRAVVARTLVSTPFAVDYPPTLPRMVGTRARVAFTAALVGIITSLAIPAAAVAQEWKCITPADCGPLVPTDGVVAFALRLEHTPSLPGAGEKVKVRSTEGVLHIGDRPMTPGTDGFVDTSTDARGVIFGYVHGAKPGQEIHLNAEVHPGHFVSKTLRVSTPVTLSHASPGFARYAGTQSWGTSVYADGVDEATCRQSVVLFAPRGGTGSVSIDSAFGKPDPESAGRCIYSTDWRLGPEVGRQVLLARSGSDAPLTITAISRRRPALRLGLAVAVRTVSVAFVENSRVADTIRVHREIQGGHVEYDSVPLARTVEIRDGWRPEAMPLILLDGPPVLGWNRLRLTVGASAINFKRDFFVGISLLQLRYGVQAEDSGFDVQFGALLSSPERLRNRELCSRDLREDRPEDVIRASCLTRDELRFDGVVATVSTDAQSLLSAVGKVFGL